MSKAQNYFKITELRRSDELHRGLKRGCKYITSHCTLCPMNEKPECVKSSLPPAAFDKSGNPLENVCADWLFLHFLGEKTDA